MKSLRWAMILGLVGFVAGCGESAPPPPPLAPPPAPRAAAPAPPAKEPEVKPPPPIPYETKGRRDPFRQPTTGIEAKGGLALASVKLVGVVQGREGPMALVEAPDGLGYVLRPGDLIGDGRVEEIGLDSVKFSMTARPGQPATRTVLKLTASE